MSEIIDCPSDTFPGQTPIRAPMTPPPPPPSLEGAGSLLGGGEP